MKFRITVLIISFFAILLYLPGLNGDFILDDNPSILQNNILYLDQFSLEQLIYASLSFHHGHGERALPMLTFALDYWRAGAMDAYTFKSTNLFIHFISILVLVGFLKKLFILLQIQEKQASYWALVLATIWAIHPIQVSSILYVVQRMQTMTTLFIFAGLWAYLSMRHNQIQGKGYYFYGSTVVVLWFFALMCKEDAVLFPLYLLVLELTVLRFNAAELKISKGLKQCYTLFGISAVLLFIFFVIPNHWYWESYPGRDFSSLERLLTQTRVLVMYIGQMLLPIPSAFPFIYDTYPVSRGLFSPWTTIISLSFLVTLFIWAIKWRNKRPLFAFGILLFFAGHFLTSNIVGLELIFEHRNHFPLIGIILAVFDLLRLIAEKYAMTRKLKIISYIFVVGFCLSSTATLAYVWGDSVLLGKKMTQAEPTSVRAWNQYATVYFRRYNQTKKKTELYNAIAVTEEAKQYIQSASLDGNIIIYKSLLGTDDGKDWENYYKSLRSTPEGWSRKQSLYLLMDNVRKGYTIDIPQLNKAIKTYAESSNLAEQDYLQLAIFVYQYGKNSSLALELFKKAIPPHLVHDQNNQEILNALLEQNKANKDYVDWIKLMQSRNS
ncbi:hypothetical protein [Acinetobacter thermotolerans]|uniref:hypothetical protein n=1 Tax=Acinetobacter thermotolerans TaxID=3151487 RepID=UPI00325C2CCA